MCPTEKVEQLTLFPEGTLDLASLLVLPGSEEARKMTATSGRKLSEFYRKSGPVGLLARMLLDTSLWGSTTSYLTWKTRATPRKHLLFRLVPSAPATEGIGYSLWPTVTATAGDGRSEQDPDVWLTRYERTLKEKGIRNGMPINVAVKMWPTLRANDSEKRGNIADDPRNGLPGVVRMWPTPAAQDAKNATMPPSQINRDSVPGAVMREMRLWPTPTAEKGMNGGGVHRKMFEDAVASGGMSEDEKNQILYTTYEGQLNPEWVEGLMNFPPKWTEVD